MASFACITFGCQMNVNDSDWVRRTLRLAGLAEVPPEEADFIFINTCSVREKPEQKVHQTIRRFIAANPRALLGIAGCVAQQMGEELLNTYPAVKLVTGSDGIASAPEAILHLLSLPSPTKQAYLDFTPQYPDRPANLQSLSPSSPHPIAYVNIMQGCDNFCAYCIVPYTRGPRKSRPSSSILEECHTWAQNGSKEINLLGQNVNAYGLDLAEKNQPELSFPQLLHAVASIPGIERIRFTTPHPKDFSPLTITAFAQIPALCPRLHLPLQAGSDSVLSRMGRKYTTAHYRQLVADLRHVRPGIAFSTDIIVGFPNETEAEFLETLAFVKEIGFVASYSFCYSDRPGTRASKMEGKIPHEVQLERLGRLQTLQEELGYTWLKSRVTTQTSVLIEGTSSKKDAPNQWQGHDPWGNTVLVDLPDGVAPVGKMVDVKIIEAKKHSLVGEVL